MQGDVSIVAENLVVGRGSKTRLSIPEMAVEGKVFALVGPNGAGKTTLMRTLARLGRPTSGWVEVVSTTSDGSAPSCSYLPQQVQAPPGVSIRRLVRHSAWLKGVKGGDRAAEDVIGRLGLDGQAPLIATKSSGGILRRAAIACALVDKPKLLILDEPTANLDIESRRQISNLIGEISNETTVVLSTHLEDDIDILRPTVIVLSEGRVIQSRETQGVAASEIRKLMSGGSVAVG